MSFTGKATFTAGSSFPEIAEDVSDLVTIVSPAETPLLNALGDSTREARSTTHEWLDDALLPNFDVIVGDVEDQNTTVIPVQHVGRFRPGDQVRVEGGAEVMLVNSLDVENGAIGVTRAYGGSTRGALSDGMSLRILGNAALEGDSADEARFAARTRRQNHTQIFSATVEVSGSELAVRQIGVQDELNYQKQLRLRELLRDLENSVINGRAATISPAGSTTVRRTMNGLISLISTNIFVPGESSFPASGSGLSEEQLNAALRQIWLSSGAPVDLIVVNAAEKRAINTFASASRRFSSDEKTYRDLVNVYESDFGVCRILLSRYVPAGTVLLLDSTRVEVLPLTGRSFFYKPLAVTGDRVAGQLLGEYTLEVRNENAHGLIRL